MFSGDKNIIEINQHNIVIIIEYKLSSLMICASKLQVNVARFQKVLFCVEIIYTNFNYSKSKHEETLAMLKIVLPNRITNLSKKKLNKFNSHPTYKKSIKKTKLEHGVTLAMLKIDFSTGKLNHPENKINNFISQNLNNIYFRSMSSYEEYLNEMETLFDPSSPGGDEDELARRMSSLGRAPEGAENPGEVGTDCSGDLDILGSELTEEGAIMKVGDAEGGEATKGDPGQIKVVDPDHQSVLEMDTGVSNQNKSRDARGSVDLELGKDRGVDNVYII